MSSPKRMNLKLTRTKQVELVLGLKEQLDLVYKQQNHLRTVCRSVDRLSRTVRGILGSDHSQQHRTIEIRDGQLLAEFVKFERNFRVWSKRLCKLDRELLNVDLYEKIYDLYESLTIDECEPIAVEVSGSAATDFNYRKQKGIENNDTGDIFIAEDDIVVKLESPELETLQFSSANSYFDCWPPSSSSFLAGDDRVASQPQQRIQTPTISKSNNFDVFSQPKLNKTCISTKNNNNNNMPKKSKKPVVRYQDSSNADFSNQYSMDDPIMIDGVETPFECAKCGRRFKKKGQWNRHQNTHQLKRCPFEGCAGVYSRQQHLKRHVQIVHTKEAPLLCCDVEGCDYSTHRSDRLKSHQLVHSDARPYQCGWMGCHYSTNRIEHLKVHRIVHTGERPFQCGQCGKSFKSSSNLCIHKKAHDIGQRYKCGVEGCHYSTHHLNFLKSHHSVHTDERPFRCDWPRCERAFKLSSNLYRHRLIHTTSYACRYRCSQAGCQFATNLQADLARHLNLEHGKQRLET